MTTIMVATVSGEKIIPAKCFVRFMVSVGGSLEELAITEIDGQATKLTHVETGAGMAKVHSTDVAVGRFDWHQIGMLTLQKLFDAKGEARVAAAIRKAKLGSLK